MNSFLKKFRNFSPIKNIRYRGSIPPSFIALNDCKKEITAGELFYRSIKRNNVKNAFIYSGGAIMPWIDMLYKSDINYYVNTHEQSSGHTLSGYSKSLFDHNDKGIVITTSGPGFTNLITPMLDMKNDSTPGVFITGQVPIEAIGSNAFQEAPSVNLSKNVTKYSDQIRSILDIEYKIDKAFKIAYSGKMGPVHLDIPKCIAIQKINLGEYMLLKNEERFSIKNYNFKNNYFYGMYQKHKIKKAIDIINISEKPVIYLGQGATNDYKIIREFANKGNIPVTTTIHGCGIFDEDSELSLQWCGMHGSAAANYSLQDSDCIIALGSRFDDRTTGLVSKYAPKCFEAYCKKKGGIIHVNIEKSEIKRVVNSHYNFNMSCKDWLDIAMKNIKYNKREDWIHNVNTLKSKHKFVEEESENLTMSEVLNKIYRKTKCLKDNLVITTGVGNHQMQTYQYIKSHYPKKILSSGSLGVMGCGVGYAIGAQIANPKKTVLLIDGDSSFNMTSTELKTIKEYNLPIKIAIMNNSSQQMVNVWEKLYFNERYTATINNNNPDYTKLADSYGIKSIKCDDPKDLEKMVNEFIKYPSAILCEFKIEKGLCLPLVGPGKALDDMILPEDFYNNNFKMEKGLAPS